MSRSKRHSYSPWAVLWLCANSAFAEVRTVGGMNPDFSTVQAAVNASNDGDVILVRHGAFAGFTVTGRSLAIVADTASFPLFNTPVRILDLSPTAHVLLAGLAFVPNTDAPGCEIQSSAGSVRAQSCAFVGGPFLTGAATRDGLRIVDTGDVALTNTAMSGGFNSGLGLVCIRSHVALFDCEAHGGEGTNFGSASGSPGTPGGAGITALDSFLFATASTATGGLGGDGLNGMICTPRDGGAGGHGMITAHSAPGAMTILNRCELVGGLGGPGSSSLSCGTQGMPGPDGSPLVGPVTQSSNFAVRLQARVVTRESGTLPIVVHGRAGDRAVLTIGVQPTFAYDPAQRGVRLLADANPGTLPLGTIPASGTLSTSFVVRELGPGIEARVRFAQLSTITPSGATTLGPAATFVWIDRDL